MYVAVKGGEAAIDASLDLLARARRGDPAVPEIGVAQIDGQLALGVDRVMAEGALHDRTLAALAIKQARGDLVEAIFLLRAYRTTLPRFGFAIPLETAAMAIARRISAAFKDLPGGQILGPSFDYTHRLLDFALLAEADPGMGAAASDPAAVAPLAAQPPMPRVTDILAQEALIERERADATAPPDLTREPLAFPAARAARLQALARGDEGFLLALGYSTQRGYANNHPFAGEIRFGSVAVSFAPEELGFEIDIGDVTVTECQMINQFRGGGEVPPGFTRGYGLVFGHNERKAMAMALVDRALRAPELDEEIRAPAQDAEFVLSHCDNVESSGFVQHLKLPHYVDFQAELLTLRDLHARRAARPEAGEDAS
jgi:alpha-D-ribose 1-methylphosphonate 5-triphosphate synthase subunit PhnI